MIFIDIEHTGDSMEFEDKFGNSLCTIIIMFSLIVMCD